MVEKAFRSKLIRYAAFEYLRQYRRLFHTVTRHQMRADFYFDTQQISLMDTQKGIFRPPQMDRLLSITTVFARSGSRVWYADQTKVQKEILDGAKLVEYDFQGNDPDLANNQHLRHAYKEKIPIIYFVGVDHGKYLPLFPVHIVDWRPGKLKVLVSLEGLYAHDPAQQSLVADPSNPYLGNQHIEPEYGERTVILRPNQSNVSPGTPQSIP